MGGGRADIHVRPEGRRIPPEITDLEGLNDEDQDIGAGDVTRSRQERPSDFAALPKRLKDNILRQVVQCRVAPMMHLTKGLKVAYGLE